MKVSVVMASYNSEKYLHQSISSIVAQTYQDWELIISDDGSTDRSAEIANMYQGRDSRINIIKAPQNRGVAHARNNAMRIARGDYIAILDADDIAEPVRLEKQVQLAEHRPDACIVMSNATAIDENGIFIRSHTYPIKSESLYKRLVGRRAFPPHSTMLYSKIALSKTTGFNQFFEPAEDCDLWFRLSEFGTFASIPQSLVQIRRHEGSISNLEGGRRQIRRGLMAASLHVIHKDPALAMVDPSGLNLLEYEAWVDEVLKQNGYYEMMAIWAATRRSLLSSKGRWLPLRLALAVLRKAEIRRYLAQKLLGTKLPYILAKQYFTNSANAKPS